MTIESFTCRACRGHEIRTILDLGVTPLANALVEAGESNQKEESFPLVVVFCATCSLVQITETVPPETLFRNYVYFSSFSDTMLAHAATIAKRLVKERGLGPASLVVEAASNDGYLLRNYVEAGIPVLGVEPARNIAAQATERGVPTVAEFFGAELAERLATEGRKADVFHANNVLAHVADLNGFVSGIASVLKPGGVAVIEAPYVRDMIEHLEFDTVYHEHLCYFSLTALDALFRRHGLSIIDCERLAIHGGSLRIFASPTATLSAEASARVKALLAEEKANGMTGESYYRDFASRVWALRDSLRATLGKLKAAGKRIAAYGASAKGSTLLNVFGLGRAELDFVVDRSPHKQGKFTPGTHLEICPPERLLEAMPDYVLLLTWNFKDEILSQQAEYRRRGGHFVLPVPEVLVV
ncbi:MAG TPA: class I SAM-dependent methyltransferase [Polyangiaceae bacterium]|jgi:SAM-dependent methyltransferase|nr:class I SAM-dependent methyltransferase [Polyangiaceae bacterium]